MKKKTLEVDSVVVQTSEHRSELHCPRCGGGNLHQSVVKVYNRNEDDPRVWRTVVTEDAVESKMAVSLTLENPSPRRQGLIISFACEACSGDVVQDAMELHIFQHKGATLLKWRFTENVSEESAIWKSSD